MEFLNKKFYVSDFEITVREIIVSICIFVFMMLIGISCSANIEESEMANNEKYTKALRIESTDLFQHGMNTNVGNAFVYGDLESVDTVTYPEIEGDYIYVKKVEERYERYEKWVTETDSNGKEHKRKKVWYEWDIENTESQHAKEIKFCGVVFPYEKLELPSSYLVDTINGDKTYSWKSGERVKVRFKYYGVDTKYTGTIFTDLRDKTISDSTVFYNNTTIEDTCEYLTHEGGSTLLWLFWIPLTAVLILLFYVADNKWLH